MKAKFLAISFFVVLTTVSGVISPALAKPTKSQCEDAMSFLGYNVTAVAKCNGLVKPSDLPDYRGAVSDCNKAYGENFVTEATKTKIIEFKNRLEEVGRQKLCPAVKNAFNNY